MTWTYDLTNTIGKVRLLIGDTDTLDQLLQDGEIQFFLDEEGNKYLAASRACNAIALTVGQRLTVKGDVGIDQDEQYKHWVQMAADLKRRGQRGAAPFAGGISQAVKETQEDDDDRVKPSFTRQLHVPPGESLGAVEPDLTSTL